MTMTAGQHFTEENILKTYSVTKKCQHCEFYRKFINVKRWNLLKLATQTFSTCARWMDYFTSNKLHYNSTHITRCLFYYANEQTTFTLALEILYIYRARFSGMINKIRHIHASSYHHMHYCKYGSHTNGSHTNTFFFS